MISPLLDKIFLKIYYLSLIKFIFSISFAFSVPLSDFMASVVSSCISRSFEFNLTYWFHGCSFEVPKIIYMIPPTIELAAAIRKTKRHCPTFCYKFYKWYYKKFKDIIFVRTYIIFVQIKLTLLFVSIPTTAGEIKPVHVPIMLANPRRMLA